MILCEFALAIAKAESRSDTYKMLNIKNEQLKNIESKLSDDMFVFIKHLSRSQRLEPEESVIKKSTPLAAAGHYRLSL